MNKKSLSLLAITGIAMSAVSFSAAAQQWNRAQVMNTGIFVLLIPPVLILAFLCYLIYKRRES